MWYRGRDYFRAMDAAIVEINRLRLHFVGYPDTEQMRWSIQQQLEVVERGIWDRYGIPMKFRITFEQGSVTITPYMEEERRT